MAHAQLQVLERQVAQLKAQVDEVSKILISHYKIYNIYIHTMMQCVCTCSYNKVIVCVYAVYVTGASVLSKAT